MWNNQHLAIGYQWVRNNQHPRDNIDSSLSKTMEVETRVVVVAGLVIPRLVVAMLVVGLVLRSVPATEPDRD